MQITRTTNSNGTYRYQAGNRVVIEASKVYYTHASTFDLQANGDESILFHKTAKSAQNAKGYKGWAKYKTGVTEIIDGDTTPEAEEEQAPSSQATSAPTFRVTRYYGDTEIDTETITGARGPASAARTWNAHGEFILTDKRKEDGTWRWTITERYGRIPAGSITVEKI